MVVTALPGIVKLREYQMGPETTFGTAVAATRIFPWKFNPTIDPHWTSPDVDAGSLDPLQPPYRTVLDITGQTTGPLAFNDLPYLQTGIAKPATASGGGANKTWTVQPAYATQDNFQLFTAEWGDETTDQFRLIDGTLVKVELDFPEDGSPVTHTGDWRFSTFQYPYARTGAPVLDQSPAWVYGADTSIFIDGTAGGIGGTAVVNGVHGLKVSIDNALDPKRFMNGSNTRFQLSGYGRGARMVETTFTFAKSSAALVEAADFLTATATERFVSIVTQSPELVPATVVAYSSTLRFSGYWFTRSEGTYANNNSTIQLVCRHRVNSTLAYPYLWTVVNGLATL